MKQHGFGRIINMGSMLALTTLPDRTAYATSKGAILQLTRALAMEVAKEGITVNAILPGPFATDINLPLLNDPVKYQAFVTKIPLGRWGELHEIGGIPLYLASRASSYVTGACFSVDGGWVVAPVSGPFRTLPDIDVFPPVMLLGKAQHFPDFAV